MNKCSMKTCDLNRSTTAPAELCREHIDLFRELWHRNDIPDPFLPPSPMEDKTRDVVGVRMFWWKDRWRVL